MPINVGFRSSNASKGAEGNPPMAHSRHAHGSGLAPQPTYFRIFSQNPGSIAVG
ncbi:hypothetical protein F7734_11990 [Scytonema sp. UIC 10036]|uniref:hypothetical protein n=1 Tax=Scytonema sp. UIC 10036 TaxID=2304196 RepID=UPI0012DA968B|nr:hypothetical protein [Scytonema sp. UIC 10036]MUG93117.1 hypothetical protein [Scytonema sp. UIC 10036]